MSTQTTPSPLTRADAAISLALTAASAAAYIRTLYPGVLPSDGAEFQALGSLLGVAHTTGYFIYLPLAKLATLLPFGSIAYRVNLFSAWMGGLTIGLVYLLCVLMTKSRWGGVVAALSMAIGGTFWSQAVIAEVYTSASAFLAGVLVLVMVWYRTRKGIYLFWAGLVGGLSLGIHGSVGLSAIAIGVLILICWPRFPKILPSALGGTLAGLILLVGAFLALDANKAPYNIFDSAYRPAISAWDRTEADIATPAQRFVFEITAVQWRPAMFANPTKLVPKNSDLYMKSLPKDFAQVTLGLMLLGFIVLFIQDWRLGVFTLVALLVHNLYTFNYDIGDNYVFYIPGYVYTAILAAGGVSGILSFIGWILKKKAVLRSAAIGAAGLLLLILAVQPLAAERWQMLRAGEAVFEFTGIPSPQETAAWYQRIRATAAAMEPNAIGYISWGDMYAYTYAAWVDLGRTDLRFIEPTPYSKKGGMAATMRKFIRSNLSQRPQYFQSINNQVVNDGIRLNPEAVGPTTLYKAVVP